MAKKVKKSRGGEKRRRMEGIAHRISDFYPPRWNHPMWWGMPSIPDLMAPANVRMPKVDMQDLGQEILVEAEMPGVRRKDLSIMAADNAVTIRAQDRYEETQVEGEYYYREMGRGEFQRMVLLPCRVDWSRAEAGFRNGILKLRLPKVEVAEESTSQQNISVD